MAQTYKSLGQAALAATTLTDVYTVPGATSAVISTITVCNRSASAATTYRLSIAPAGAGDATSQYFAYDVTLQPNEAHTWTIGIAMATTDKFRAYAGAATVTVGAYGVENT